MENKIITAFYKLKRIRKKNWSKEVWCKFTTSGSLIFNDGHKTSCGECLSSIYTNVEDWEIWHEDDEQLTNTKKAIELLKSQGYEVFKKM